MNRARVSTLLRSRGALWTAFVLVHVVLALENLYSARYPMGDVTVQYLGWTRDAFDDGQIAGIDTPWVYPIVAILPMLASYVFGSAGYAFVWLIIVTVLDAVALAVLTRRGGVGSLGAGWWWTGFLLALGPIALGRIDTVSVSVALIGGVIVATRPLLATVLVTIAVWIKVWPAALLGAFVFVVRRRVAIVLTAIVTSGVIAAVALGLGSRGNVTSFVSQQTDRTLQVEAPVTTIWMWRAFADAPETSVYYHRSINTWEVTGDGVLEASRLMTPLMAGVALVIAILAVVALRRGVPALELGPVLALAFVVCLIAFNKVGSPQYITWLAVPIVMGIAAGSRFRVPAVLAIIIGLLTRIVYPSFYDALLALDPRMLVVLSIRNLLLLALLGWAVVRLLVPSKTPLAFAR